MMRCKTCGIVEKVAGKRIYKAGQNRLRRIFYHACGKRAYNVVEGKKYG